MRMRWVGMVVVAVGACGGDDDGDARTGSLIALVDRVDRGDIIGWFYDHDLPGTVVLAADGSCEFHDGPSGPKCDPACGDGQICAPDGTCAVGQELVSIGTLTVGGTSAGDSSDIPHTQFGTYELHQTRGLFGGPTEVDVTATGSDDFAPFAMSADAPGARLTPDGASEPGWPGLAADQDLALSWGAPDADSRVRVTLLDDVGAASIYCDAADAGSLTVPGSLISQFLEVGDFSQPGGGVSAVDRYRRTSISVDGHQIDLLISSGTEFWAVPDP